MFNYMILQNINTTNIISPIHIITKLIQSNNIKYILYEYTENTNE